mmetsp:Transcript_58570/g.115164  ORF Transcript_58570/g.115164 Transcript_58570/m.115164 type:complete len:90 (-) Transcript_58570:116-385(-)
MMDKVLWSVLDSRIKTCNDAGWGGFHAGTIALGKIRSSPADTSSTASPLWIPSFGERRMTITLLELADQLTHYIHKLLCFLFKASIFDL